VFMAGLVRISNTVATAFRIIRAMHGKALVYGVFG